MEFRVLGPLEVLRGTEPVALGRRRGQRCLLGLLLLDADVGQPDRLYGMVVVAVLLSVCVQGSMVPTLMRRLGIRTRPAES